MSSANRDHLTSFLPSWMAFISFSHMIAAARIYSTMLNKSGESEHPCLVPDLREMHSFFHQYYVSCGILYVTIIMLKYIFSKPSLFRFLS